MKRIYFVLVLFLSVVFSAKGQTTISVGGSVSDFSDVKNGCGASVVLGWMAKYGFWQFGLSARMSSYANEFPYMVAEDGTTTQYPEVDYTDTDRQSYRFIFSTSYMVRVIGNHNHSLNVYLGAGAFGGYEKSDPFKTYNVLEGGTIESKDTDNSTPVCGLYPEFQAEAFLTGRLSFFADAQYRFDFLSSEKRSFPMIGVGFRILL